MQILHPFTGSIQQYNEELKHSDRYRPSCCPLCQAKHALISHGFYCRTIEAKDFDGIIRIRRYLCRFCRRTVSLLPEFALPYLRFSIITIGLFLAARFEQGKTLKASGSAAGVPEMPYQRGQHWIRRFRSQASALTACLVSLIKPMKASSFINRALRMLDAIGWIRAHRFLFAEVRAHILGWPLSLAPEGRCRSLRPA